jgi:hypothetical protein
VVSGQGLAEALDSVDVIVDVATQPTPDEEAATAFFTASARNLQEKGERAGVKRIVLVSIIGIDRFSAGYYAAKLAQERAMLSGPIPVRILRAAQFHEFVPQLVEWGRQGAEPRAQYANAARRRQDRRRGARRARERFRTRPGNLWAAVPGARGPARGTPRRGGEAAGRPPRNPVRIEEMRSWDYPESELWATDALLPGPDATLAGPTFEEWLDSTP